MKPSHPPWFAISAPNEKRIRCAACNQVFESLYMTADHDPAVCPICGVECMFLDWKTVGIQIVMDRAPTILTRVLRWTQENLDALDFAELLCQLEELSEARPAPDNADSPS